jgi:RNase adaptor protein for sRNA GlmZ degradation
LTFGVGKGEQEVKALEFVQRYKKWSPCDVLVDARCLSEPRDHDLFKHCGLHPKIMSRMVRHVKFAEMLKAAQKDLQQHWRGLNLQPPERRTTLPTKVGVYCTRGYHRSVAFARILQSILERLGNRCEWYEASSQALRWTSTY